jgi:hypothetical protein
METLINKTTKMKLIKSLLLCFAVVFSIMGATAQNCSINLLTLNSGIVNQNGTVFLQVDIGNTDASLSVPSYKLRPQISVPAIVTIPTSGHQLPSGWAITTTVGTTTTGNTIRLTHGTDNIPPQTTRTILIALQGVTIGGPSTISGNLLFSNGVAPGSASGTSLPGDNTADNTSTSTVEVIAAPACGITAVSASAGTISCNGGTTTLTVSATGGSGLEYSINGGAFQSSNTFTVSAGSYTATAREAANTSCSLAATSATVVTQPTAVSVSASAGTIACNGGTTTLTASGSGGTGTLQYSINGGAFQSGTTFTVNAGGSPYTVTARDANSCTATSSSVPVTQPTAVSASGSVSTPITVIGGTGAITVTASGGTGSKTYVITSGTTINTTGASTGVFTGLLAGTYTFTATDANSCTGVTSSVVLSEGACTLAVSASAGTISCNGGTTTLTAIASGNNSAAVEYSLNSGSFQSSNTFTVSAGASYVVTARLSGNTGCTATSNTVSVSQPTAISASASAGSIACNGGNTTLTVTASGGTGSLEYSLNGGTFQSGNTFTVNAAGSPYTVTVRDANSCTASTSSVTVSQPAAVPAPSISSTNNGNNTFTLTATGFTGTLLWSTGATTASILVSTAGTYTVTQTVGGCTSAAASQTVTLGNSIADPAVGQLYFTTLADATQSANTLAFGQNYKLNIPVFNLNQFTEVPSSSINLRINLGTRIRLASGFDLTTAPLSQYFSFSAAIVADSQIVTGVQIAPVPADFDGVATLQVDGILSCTSETRASIVITNSSASVTDEDLNNNNARLRYTLPVTLSATPVNVTCFGAANGNITVVASAGTTVVFRNSSSQVVTAPFGPGTYTVTATASADANIGTTCSSEQTVTISQPAQLTLTLAGTTAAICNGGNTGTITVVGGGGTAPYGFTIAGPTVNTTGATSGIFSGLTAGNYTVTVTDANGCTAQVSATVSQPTGTATDLSLGSDITGSLFATPGTSQTIVYNISEIAGNAAVGDTLRITRVSGFDISFNTSLTSVVIAPTNYTLDNPNWKVDNSNPAFVSLILKASGGAAGPGIINCGETVRIAVTLTRNTSDISTFPLSARLRKANGELNLSNNFNSIIFTAD